MLEIRRQIKDKYDISNLYKKMAWFDYLKLNEDQLYQSMENSYSVVYVYDESDLVASGRVVSDGVINAYICGVCVLEPYRKHGIGSSIVKELIKDCENKSLHIQLVCEDHLKSYYEKLGFNDFAIAMKYNSSSI